jgi:hypothetical protein
MKLASSFEYLKPFKSDLIRVGPQGDCGYVIPRSVAENTNGMYSIGISTDWEFEAEMAARNPKLKIQAFDRTSGWTVFAYVALRDLLRGDPSELERMTLISKFKSFKRYFLLSIKFRFFFSGRRRFKRQWVRELSSLKSEISFADSIQGLFDEDEVMLKIDIEGGEYELSKSLIECLKQNSKKINCVVMEFHDTRARRTEFEHLVQGVSSVVPIVHIHGNNCVLVAPDGLPEVVEITFAKDCKNSYSDNLSFPLAGLDFANDSNKPDIAFSFMEA